MLHHSHHSDQNYIFNYAHPNPMYQDKHLNYRQHRHHQSESSGNASSSSRSSHLDQQLPSVSINRLRHLMSDIKNHHHHHRYYPIQNLYLRSLLHHREKHQIFNIIIIVQRNTIRIKIFTLGTIQWKYHLRQSNLDYHPYRYWSSNVPSSCHTQDQHYFRYIISFASQSSWVIHHSITVSVS